jgi:hypothetical protein
MPKNGWNLLNLLGLVVDEQNRYIANAIKEFIQDKHILIEPVDEETIIMNGGGCKQNDFSIANWLPG